MSYRAPTRDTLVSLYYYEHLTLQDIGDMFGHSHEWASKQMSLQGLATLDKDERARRIRLRAKLDKFDPSRRVRNIMPKQYNYWLRQWNEFWRDVRVSRGLEIEPDTATEYAEAMV